MNDYISLIREVSTPKAFRRVMTQLNALDVKEEEREILKELLKTITEKSGDFEYEYSLLYFIYKHIFPSTLEKKYPKIYEAAKLINTPQKIELCDAIITAMIAEKSVKKLDRHCLRFVRFVREGLHPDLISCDSLMESRKGCDKHALILFKMGFAASKESCFLLAKKMIRLTDAIGKDDNSRKMINILGYIEDRYPELILRDELYFEATDRENIAAVRWLLDKRASKKQESELSDISFGEKKKKKSRKENSETYVEKDGSKGLGHQLAALKDSPRNRTDEPNSALVTHVEAQFKPEMK